MYHEDEKKTSKKVKISLVSMSLAEIRSEIETYSFDLSGITGINATRAKKFVSMSIKEFTRLYKKYSDPKNPDKVYEIFGAYKADGRIIPNGWGSLPTLADIITLRIEEMNRIEYAKGAELKELNKINLGMGSAE